MISGVTSGAVANVPFLRADEQAEAPIIAAPNARVGLALAQYFELIWRTLRRFGVPPARVDDAAQLVFMVLLEKIDQVEFGKERAFLLATATRVACNERRTEARRFDTPSELIEEAPASGASPEKLLDFKQRRQLLDDALDTLPIEQRTVFVLYELEGFEIHEIAEALAIPLGTVASRLRRARAKFESWSEQFRQNRGALR